MGNFRDLRVWEEGIDLAANIYGITRGENFRKDFGLCNQIQRASVSISSNIAEGDERGSNRESVHFFNIAKGSCAEVITQLHVAHKIGYINDETLEKLENQSEKIRASLKKLIAARGGGNKFKNFSWFLLTIFLPIT